MAWSRRGFAQGVLILGQPVADAQAALSVLEGRLRSGLQAPVEVFATAGAFRTAHAQSEDLFVQGCMPRTSCSRWSCGGWHSGWLGVPGPEWMEATARPGWSPATGDSMPSKSYVRPFSAAAERCGRVNPPSRRCEGTRLESDWLDSPRAEGRDLLARAEAFGMSSNAQSEVSRARLVHRYGLSVAQLLRPPDPPWKETDGLAMEAVGEAVRGLVSRGRCDSAVVRRAAPAMTTRAATTGGDRART
jgi:hypothetical protein